MRVVLSASLGTWQRAPSWARPRRDRQMRFIPIRCCVVSQTYPTSAVLGAPRSRRRIAVDEALDSVAAARKTNRRSNRRSNSVISRVISAISRVISASWRRARRRHCPRQRARRRGHVGAVEALRRGEGMGVVLGVPLRRVCRGERRAERLRRPRGMPNMGHRVERIGTVGRDA